METIALIEIVPIVVVLISFLLPHHTSIHQPLTYHSYHHELRGAGEEPGEVILVNHVPTFWINKSVPLISDDLPCPTLHITSHLAYLVLIENAYSGPDMIIHRWQLLSFLLATWTAYCSQDYFLLW